MLQVTEILHGIVGIKFVNDFYNVIIIITENNYAINIYQDHIEMTVTGCHYYGLPRPLTHANRRPPRIERRRPDVGKAA